MPSNEEKFENLLESSKERLKSSVYIVAPDDKGWLLKRNSTECWISKKVFRGGGTSWKKKNNPPVESPHFSMRPDPVKKYTINENSVLHLDDVDNNPYGFGISFNDGRTPTLHLRASSSEEKQKWLDALSILCVIARRFASVEKKRILGVGGQGIVYEAFVKELNVTIAMKEIEIKNDYQMRAALSEASMLQDIMEHVAHPNIIAIKKIFHFGSKFYLIFPLCTGGELLDHIIRHRHFKEENSLKVIHDLVSALHALHAHNILHLDIKPENILYESQEPDAKIKVTDFGLSRLFSDAPKKAKQQMPTFEELQEKKRLFIDLGLYATESIIGTMGYMSPELILTGYVSEATDVFAAGVVLYIMLCGERPFASRSNRQTFMKTIMGSFRMTSPEWKSVSKDTKELVSRMLDVNPATRITTAEILALPFIRKYETEEPARLDKQGDSESGKDTPTAVTKMASLVKELKAEKLVHGLSLLNLNKRPKKFDDVDYTPQPNMHSDLAGKYLASPIMNGDFVLHGEHFKNPWNDDKVRLGLLGSMRSMGDAMGRLTVRQYFGIYRKIGLAGVPRSPEDVLEEVSLALFVNFVDSDGDGFITGQDVITANSFIANRHEIFLALLFSVYVESLPNARGQSSSLLPQLLNGPVLRRCIASGELKINNFDTSLPEVLDPSVTSTLLEGKYITEEHVAYMFSKYGYPEENGREVFNHLYNSLATLGLQNSKYDSDSTTDEEDSDDSGETGSSKLSEKIYEKKIYLDQFIELSKLDDILVLLVFIKGRHQLLMLQKSIEDKVTHQRQLSESSAKRRHAEEVKSLLSAIEEKGNEDDEEEDVSVAEIATAEFVATFNDVVHDK